MGQVPNSRERIFPIIGSNILKQVYPFTVYSYRQSRTKAPAILRRVCIRILGGFATRRVLPELIEWPIKHRAETLI
jgi:hypothetical protein